MMIREDVSVQLSNTWASLASGGCTLTSVMVLLPNYVIPLHYYTYASSTYLVKDSKKLLCNLTGIYSKTKCPSLLTLELK
jgi:hypothetical protein